MVESSSDLRLPVLYGAKYSVYTCIARLALVEKRVEYRLEEVDIFAASGPPHGYLDRHPFKRIPAFEHAGMGLYETGAIVRYVDEAFPGVRLQPQTPTLRARMNQAVSILDAYAYRTWVWDIFVERVRKPQRGEHADEARIARALPTARTCLSSLQAIQDCNTWLAAPQLTLADLYCLPMLTLFARTPEGEDMLQEFPGVTQWLARMSERESAQTTRFPLETE